MVDVIKELKVEVARNALRAAVSNRVRGSELLGVNEAYKDCTDTNLANPDIAKS